MKITLDLPDAGLYRAIKVEAARQDRSVREVVDEALRTWLERAEDAEDAAAAAVALAEYAREGGVSAAEFLAQQAGEVLSRYGSAVDG